MRDPVQAQFDKVIRTTQTWGDRKKADFVLDLIGVVREFAAKHRVKRARLHWSYSGLYVSLAVTGSLDPGGLSLDPQRVQGRWRVVARSSLFLFLDTGTTALHLALLTEVQRWMMDRKAKAESADSR